MRNARQLKKEMGEQKPFQLAGIPRNRFRGRNVADLARRIDHTKQRFLRTGKFRISGQNLPPPLRPLVKEMARFAMQRLAVKRFRRRHPLDGEQTQQMGAIECFAQFHENPLHPVVSEMIEHGGTPHAVDIDQRKLIPLRQIEHVAAVKVRMEQAETDDLPCKLGKRFGKLLRRSTVLQALMEKIGSRLLRIRQRAGNQKFPLRRAPPS